MKVWLDDIREAPEGWVRATTALEAVTLLREKEVTEISLDHDLGKVDPLRTIYASGYDVAKFIERQVYDSKAYVPPKVHIHTDNPVGRANIRATMEKVEKLLNQRG